MGLVRLNERDRVSSSRISLDFTVSSDSHVLFVHFRKALKVSTCDGGVVLKIDVFPSCIF